MYIICYILYILLFYPGAILSEPDVVSNVVQQISEPTFQSLGLGGNSPIGLVQQMMEYIHVNIGMPWWATIVATTFLFRTLMMPLVIRGQANAAKLNNIKPELDILTQRMRKVANTHDNTKKAEASRDLQNLFLKHNCHPLKVCYQQTYFAYIIQLLLLESILRYVY